MADRVHLAVVVQAHPSRRELAEHLARTLDGVVVYDPDPAGEPSPWRTYRECIAATGNRHTLIVQDDAVCDSSLLLAARRMIHRHPHDLLCLWHGRHPQHTAIRMSGTVERYLDVRPVRFVPCVALIWPPHLAAGMREWRPRRECRADDEMIARFLRESGSRYLVTVPSVVDHGNEPSLMGTPRERRALMLAGPEEIDWDR